MVAIFSAKDALIAVVIKRYIKFTLASLLIEGWKSS